MPQPLYPASNSSINPSTKDASFSSFFSGPCNIADITLDMNNFRFASFACTHSNILNAPFPGGCGGFSLSKLFNTHSSCFGNGFRVEIPFGRPVRFPSK